MTDDRFGLLAVRHLDGLADGGERAELEQLLADAGNRRRLIALAGQHVRMGAALATQAAAVEETRPARMPRPLVAVAAAAALALAIAGVYVEGSDGTAARETGPSRPALLLGLRGDATADGAPLAIGQSVAPGVRLRCGADGALTLGWDDGATSLALGPGSDARLGEGRVEVTQGDVRARVSGQPLTVDTPLGVIAMAAGAFAAEATPAMMALSVDAGEAAVTRHGDGRRIALGAGWRGALAARGEPDLSPQAGWTLLDDGEDALPRLRREVLADAASSATLTSPAGFSGATAIGLSVELADATGGDAEAEPWALLSLIFDRRAPPLTRTSGLGMWVHAPRRSRLWVEALGSGGYQAWERFEQTTVVEAGWTFVRLPWREFTRRQWQPPGAPTSSLDPGDLQGINLALLDEVRYDLAVDRVAAYTAP